MERYDRNFRNEPVRSRNVAGEDPNYRNGTYRGMRMQAAEPGRAPYGRNRLRHAGDLGGYGNFQGVYGGGERMRGPRYDNALLNRYDQSLRVPRPGFRRGGNGPRRDREMLGEFNANSPALRSGGNR
jgi:hypothetical protein